MNAGTLSENAPATIQYVECVNHLCRLESKLDLFRNSSGVGATFDKIDAVSLILVELITFCQARLSHDGFSQFGHALLELHDRIKALDGQMNREAWGAIARMLRLADSHEFEINVEYEAIRDKLSQFLADYFVTCIELSKDAKDSEKQVFLEGGASFLSELLRNW